jgi:hypothetical protein
MGKCALYSETMTIVVVLILSTETEPVIDLGQYKVSKAHLLEEFVKCCRAGRMYLPISLKTFQSRALSLRCRYAMGSLSKSPIDEWKWDGMEGQRFALFLRLTGHNKHYFSFSFSFLWLSNL